MPASRERPPHPAPVSDLGPVIRPRLRVLEPRAASRRLVAPESSFDKAQNNRPRFPGDESSRGLIRVNRLASTPPDDSPSRCGTPSRLAGPCRRPDILWRDSRRCCPGRLAGACAVLRPRRQFGVDAVTDRRRLCVATVPEKMRNLNAEAFDSGGSGSDRRRRQFSVPEGVSVVAEA
ncbi:hypothetical protein Maq22A_c28205 [Methylobacterium aquaticum]|uniref:Uncharacterized protein n=1 Tax=Methylobacterium aquaticum TaxID=270351 RepID=A0A1Y0ZCC4_9HYPH|nr:hypothetical protein Maq22A_c28205 [Methylobacterium aquaticum]